MTLSVELQVLRAELEALGMVVVPFREELHVRLSTLERIKIRIRDGRLECEPWAAAMPRVRGTWSLAILGSIAIATLLQSSGVTPSTLTVAFIVVMSMVFNGVRHVLADSCITRIQMAWLNCRPRLAEARRDALQAEAQKPLLQQPVENGPVERQARAHARPERGGPERGQVR